MTVYACVLLFCAYIYIAQVVYLLLNCIVLFFVFCLYLCTDWHLINSRWSALHYCPKWFEGGECPAAPLTQVWCEWHHLILAYICQCPWRADSVYLTKASRPKRCISFCSVVIKFLGAFMTVCGSSFFSMYFSEIQHPLNWVDVRASSVFSR